MKKFLLFIFLTMIAFAVNAQKFFYVETETGWEKLIKEKLLKSSQFVAKSVLESEYIIKPEINNQTKDNLPKLSISVVDTVTSQTVFVAEENYSTAFTNMPSILASRMAIQTLIEKNIGEIILYAKHDSFHKMVRLIGLKKDKT
ncbi:MAG TPA: hypothetical protein VKT28_21370 [Puia sp.]|nr:hypothetical protein [Puia sp.]